MRQKQIDIKTARDSTSKLNSATNRIIDIVFLGGNSMSSGDDIQAGRVTTAESTTDILGAVPSERDVDFNGVVILRVAPQTGNLGPQIPIDGIHGVEHSQGFDNGGTGVVGFGGQNEGTGIAGLGGGLHGGGGIGVLGTGGSLKDGVLIPAGPIAPGPGVLGRGGVPIPSQGPVAAGVIGLAGGTAIPSISESGDSGVYGAGPIGVRGQGSSAPGVFGTSTGAAGVGGNSTEGVGVAGSSVKAVGDYFASQEAAQIHLEPHP